MSLAYQIRGMTGAAPEVHLNGTIGTGDSSFAFAPGEGTGWPTANIPAIIDYDNGFAEKVFIGTRSGVNCTGVLRGEDNTTAKSHSSGAKIRHVGFAQDFIESNAVAAALTTKGDSLWKGGTLSVAPARLAAGSDQQVIRYKAANALGVETTWLGSIPVFSTTGARDAAITAPSSGQAAYVDSGDSAEGLYFYNGTSWRKSSWNEPWGIMALPSTTSLTTGIAGTTTDVTGLSATFTAVTGRYYRITWSVHGLSSVDGDNFNIFLTDGSNAQVGNTQMRMQTAITSVSGLWVGTIAAGSVTRKVRAQRSAGTGTGQVGGGANQAAYVIVEDMGPSGAPT